MGVSSIVSAGVVTHVGRLATPGRAGHSPPAQRWSISRGVACGKEAVRGPILRVPIGRRIFAESIEKHNRAPRADAAMLAPQLAMPKPSKPRFRLPAPLTTLGVSTT